MYSLRRWWDRHGLQVGLVAVAIAGAWGVQQTQGSAIFEIFRTITLPFQSSPSAEEQIEKARMMAQSERLVELENQNQKLKELLGYVSSSKDQGVIAPLIGRSADHWWQQVTLGRGSRDGIKEGDIVTGAGGLVGRVESVSPNTSRVLLISDPSARVGVTISRSRNMGFMRGQGANRAVMEFFDKVPDVRPGDVVSTSPVSELFPPGIPVGRVESVNLSNSPAPEAIIELSVPINVLEWVEVKPSKILPDKEFSAPPPVRDTRDAGGPEIYPDGSRPAETEKPAEPQPNNSTDASTETPPPQPQDQL